MLTEKFNGLGGRLISYSLIITTTLLPLRLSYAQQDFDQAVIEANAFATQLLNDRENPTYDASGNLLVDGQVYMSKEDLTGQREGDYLPAGTDTFGSDAQTLYQAQAAQNKYEEKTLDTAETSAERAYHIIKKSINTQKPDLENDPIWENTDNVLDNLEEISKDFANCTIQTELVSTGKDYHVPKYEQCERLPAIEDNFTIGHEYKVGVIKHKSGPANLLPCGEGCTQVWIGTVGDNYWSGYCSVYEENMSVEVIQPNKISYAKLDYSKFDDYHQVYLNEVKIYNGPNGNFPPETSGPCELSKSWEKYPNINITNSFTNVAPNDEVRFKTRTSVADKGEGYSSLKVFYDPTDLVYDEVWYDQDLINKAHTIKEQLNDGFCEGSIRCTDMPSLDASGCTVMNGVKVCESNFENNPVADLGISPFCRKIEVSSNCLFNEGEICFTDMDGNETCFDNDTVDRNGCEKYEENPSCSYIKSECVEGAMGDSGLCYVQEDTYDCGFTASTGTPSEEEVLTCDGQLQCVGENCYSSVRDEANGDFGKVNAYLEMLKYARSDMTCEGIPEAPYDDKTPPDRYEPISSCPDGYKFNTESKQCLKETSCAYSDADFYAASYRNGIQILLNDTVIADEASIPSCVPLTKNAVTYTCGDAKKKLATDTFHEVCTNDSAPMQPDSCPSEGHIINPATGYCEIPPIVECEEGYNLIEGDNDFSFTDDYCQSKRFNVDKTCSDGYTLQGNKCEKNLYDNYYLTCPSGMSLSGSICSSYTSPSNPSRGYCSFSPPTGFNSGCGSDYSPPCSTTCRSASGNSITVSGTWHAGNCPSGKVLHNGRCYVKKTSSASKKCSSGYILSGNQCIKTLEQDYVPVCPSGFDLSPDRTFCIKNPEQTPVKNSCPSQYPVWNETESRCTAKSLSPLANEPRNTNSSEREIAQVLSIVLAPFEMMVSGLVPSVTADSDLHGSEKARVTQESMNKYIAGKFVTMADTYKNDLGLYQSGTEQLMGLANSRTMPLSSQAKGATGDGDENVTCELFKGTAMECKVAVGGMQDCCESPVAVSLADYIALTTKMIEMDALTGEVAGLDGYTGVWDIASNWGSATVESAWSAVQGEFISPADIVAQGGDGAISTAMSSVAQSMMQYTNTFLIETFGPEVAAMFFQSTGAGAAATIGPSSAMQAVGAALQVVYYAYLAYVVFNLLIGIIFECEDEEMDLAMKNELLSTHYLGTYCKTEVLGACIEKRRSYCVFDSPLSRIMMEQIYKQRQMGLDWGTAKNPNCMGLAIDGMDKIDWDLVNLDEWIGILIETDNYTDMVNVDLDSLTGSGSNLNYQEDGIDRENVLEANKIRMEDIDVDNVRREAYEDAWNKQQ